MAGNLSILNNAAQTTSNTTSLDAATVDRLKANGFEVVGDVKATRGGGLSGYSIKNAGGQITVPANLIGYFGMTPAEIHALPAKEAQDVVYNLQAMGSPSYQGPANKLFEIFSAEQPEGTAAGVAAMSAMSNDPSGTGLEQAIDSAVRNSTNPMAIIPNAISRTTGGSGNFAADLGAGDRLAGTIAGTSDQDILTRLALAGAVAAGAGGMAGAPDGTAAGNLMGTGYEGALTVPAAGADLTAYGAGAGGTAGALASGAGGTAGALASGAGGTAGGMLGGSIIPGVSNGQLLGTGLTIGGGLLQGQQAADAAQTSANAQIEAAKIAADAAKFRPVGVTTRFGTSKFGYDDKGNLTSAGYELTPEMKAQQDKLMGISGTALDQYQGVFDRTKPMGTAADTMFNLGQSYLATTPEAQAQKYYDQQQALLAGTRASDYANIQNKLLAQGRGGLSIGGGGGMTASNPEMQAYYNALRQQDLGLAAQATQGGMDYAKFGAGMAGAGGDMLKSMYGVQNAAYGPYETALGGASNLESLGQGAMNIGSSLGSMSSNAAAAGGRAMQIGLTDAARTMQPANAWSPWGDILAGAGYDLNKYTKPQKWRYVNGGKIQGQGTETSDSIPAVIDGNTPASLSTNEFVMSAPSLRLTGEEILNAINEAGLAKRGGMMSSKGHTSYADGGIVSSIFGASPYEIQRQQQANIDTRAADYAQLDPLRRASQSLYQGGAGLGQAGAGMMGLVDPAVQEAQRRQAALQGVDTSSPEAILQRASQIQDPLLKTQLVMLARESQAAIDKSMLEQARTMKALREQEGSKAAPKEIEVGVNGRPGWMRRVLVDEKGKEIYSGEPYKSTKYESGMSPADELRWMNQHSKDYTAAISTIDTSNDAINKINSIKSDPKFGYLFGGYSEKALAKFAPGEIAGIQSNIDSLKSNLMSAGLNAMKTSTAGGGIGAITEREWPIFEKLVASLDQKMDEKTARKRFDEIYLYFDRSKNRVGESYKKKWKSKKDFYDPSIMNIIKESNKQPYGGVKFLGFE